MLAAIFGAPPSAHAAAAVRAAFADLTARPGADAAAYSPVHEHAWLLIDAARCFKRCCADGEHRRAAIAAYAAAFPGLAAAAATA